MYDNEQLQLCRRHFWSDMIKPSCPPNTILILICNVLMSTIIVHPCPSRSVVQKLRSLQTADAPTFLEALAFIFESSNKTLSLSN